MTAGGLERATGHAPRVLAALHAWTLAAAPRLDRVSPSRAEAGAPIVLEGRGFAAGPLTAHFGPAQAHAVVLRDDLAVVVAPTAAGPLSVSRLGLRSGAVAFGGPSDDAPARVVRVDPWDGAAGVLRDAPVVLRLSHPADPGSVSERTLRVVDDTGPVPGAWRESPDALVLVWLGTRPLEAGATHFVQVAGLHDRSGRPFVPHLSRFVPCGLSRKDLSID